MENILIEIDKRIKNKYRIYTENKRPGIFGISSKSIRIIKIPTMVA